MVDILYRVDITHAQLGGVGGRGVCVCVRIGIQGFMDSHVVGSEVGPKAINITRWLRFSV